MHEWMLIKLVRMSLIDNRLSLFSYMTPLVRSVAIGAKLPNSINVCSCTIPCLGSGRSESEVGRAFARGRILEVYPGGGTCETTSTLKSVYEYMSISE